MALSGRPESPGFPRYNVNFTSATLTGTFWLASERKHQKNRPTHNTFPASPGRRFEVKQVTLRPSLSAQRRTKTGDTFGVKVREMMRLGNQRGISPKTSLAPAKGKSEVMHQYSHPSPR